ncbi:MAG: hypothetical protein ACLFVT_04720 [Syntrophobacteria bacterium]
MILKPCLDCQYHEIRHQSMPMSYCTKENCFSQHSRCIINKALRQYLNENQVQGVQQSPALDLLYPKA